MGSPNRRKKMAEGSGVANSSWKSQLPLEAKRSISELTWLRTSGSSSPTLRGTNSGLRSRRYQVCSGGSIWRGMRGCSCPMEKASEAEENTSGCLRAHSTSS